MHVLANMQGWRKDPVNNDPIVASPAVSRKSAAKPSAQRGKNGIMRGMKKNAKRALIFAAAIAGGLAAPLRSDATNHGFISAPSHMLGISHFKLMAS